MRRRASADEVFQAFDRKIEDYLKKNRSAIESRYKSLAGRPVDGAELDSFMSSLGDSLYDGVKLDPQHLARFVDFYVGDERLGKIVDEAVEAAATNYGPARAASDVEAIASALDRARCPSLSKLLSAVDVLSSRLG